MMHSYSSLFHQGQDPNSLKEPRPIAKLNCIHDNSRDTGAVRAKAASTPVDGTDPKSQILAECGH